MGFAAADITLTTRRQQAVKEIIPDKTRETEKQKNRIQTGACVTG
jgi:hypothetical protein